jgi:hypothetical protein
MIFTQLQQFRQTLYEMMGHNKDVMFELMDAVLTTPELSSLVRLSQNPLFRRQWSNVYDGLKRGKIPRLSLLKSLIGYIPCEEVPMLVGDLTGLCRQDAVTLKDRTYQGSSNGKISLGHSYSTLGWVPESQGSWVLPLCHDRLSSFETPRKSSCLPTAICESSIDPATFSTV